MIHNILGLTCWAVFGPADFREDGSRASEGDMKKTRFTEDQMVRPLEQENGKLKKLVAERNLEIEVLKELRRPIVTD